MENDFNKGMEHYNAGRYSEALAYFEKASDSGNYTAQFNIGIMYDNGKGVPQDKQKAFYWYEKSAGNGYAIAQYNLGGKYYRGEGVEEDKQKAVYWFERAAEQNFALAQNNLSLLYKKGDGVARDEKKSVKWLLKAAVQGHDDAKKEIEKLGYSISNGKSMRTFSSEKVVSTGGTASAAFVFGIVAFILATVVIHTFFAKDNTFLTGLQSALYGLGCGVVVFVLTIVFLLVRDGTLRETFETKGSRYEISSDGAIKVYDDGKLSQSFNVMGCKGVEVKSFFGSASSVGGNQEIRITLKDGSKKRLTAFYSIDKNTKEELGDQYILNKFSAIAEEIADITGLVSAGETSREWTNRRDEEDEIF